MNSTKMSKKLTFANVEIEKCKFHFSKHPVDIKNVNIDKIMISNKASFCKKRFKYFIGYDYDDKNKPLCIMFPQITVYAKSFDETKNYVDEKLLKAYNKMKLKFRQN